MRKWNWLKGLLSVGTALVGSAALAGEGSNIPTIADPDHVFQQTSYDALPDLGLGGNNGECGGSLLNCKSDPWKAIDASECGWNIGGWTSFGYGDKPDGIFVNDAENGRLNLNQLWLFAEKALDTESDCISWGGRIDLLYGTDAANTQAFGNNPGEWDFINGWDHGIYGWAMPQLYGTVGNGDWDIKAGHFYTYHGYEVVGATGNFFYSHAYTFNNSEPFTHTGVMLHKKVSDTVDVMGGYVLGWDTGFDQFAGGSAFMGQVGVQVTDTVKFTYTTCVGDLGFRGDGSNHTFLLDVAVTEKLKYVLCSDLVSTNGTWTNGVVPPAFLAGAGNDQVSLCNYLIYQLSDCVSAGSRLEWWKSDGQSINEFTVGLNVKPHSNVVIRPEIRHDWNPGTGALLNGRADDEQTSFNFDVIFTF